MSQETSYPTNVISNLQWDRDAWISLFDRMHRSQKVCRNDALEIVSLESAALPEHCPVDSYSPIGSKQNFQPTLESVGANIKEVARKVWEAILAFLKRVGDYLKGLFSDDRPKADEIQRLTEKSIEKVKAKPTPKPDMNKLPADEAYTHGIRELLTQPRNLEQFFAYSKKAGNDLEISKSVVDALLAFFSNVKPSIEKEALLNQTAQVNGQLQALQKHVDDRTADLLRVRFKHISINHPQTTNTTAALKSIVSDFKTAFRTESGVNHQIDLTDDEQYSRAIQLASSTYRTVEDRMLKHTKDVQALLTKMDKLEGLIASFVKQLEKTPEFTDQFKALETTTNQSLSLILTLIHSHLLREELAAGMKRFLANKFKEINVAPPEA